MRFHPLFETLDDRETLESIRADLGDCRRCELCESRKNIVYGIGYDQADLMFIGEAPGEAEDLRGTPFVGKAGRKLWQILRQCGVRMEDVYIANVLKCRPPENRDPDPGEIEKCWPFLYRQIKVVHPRVLVTLGKCATEAVLGECGPMRKERGKIHQYRDIRVIPTFHPSFALRSPTNENFIINDVLMATTYTRR